MKRILLAICVMAVSVVSYGQSSRAPFTFAWLSDVHLNSFAYAEDDLRQSIEDINANPAVDFAILSGDVTEFGDTKEFLLLQEILKNFRKPYLLLPGNHDVNWSENGCTMFNKIFKASHFCYDWQGVRFIGWGGGGAVAPVRACVWDLPTSRARKYSGWSPLYAPHPGSNRLSSSTTSR